MTNVYYIEHKRLQSEANSGIWEEVRHYGFVYETPHFVIVDMDDDIFFDNGAHVYNNMEEFMSDGFCNVASLEHFDRECNLCYLGEL